MIRKISAIATASVWMVACTAQAQDFVADAFGMVQGTPDPHGRGAWAGLQVVIDDTGQTIGTQLVRPELSETTLLFSGPKSIAAGKGTLQVVALGLDGFGNLVNDGTSAVFYFLDELKLPLRTVNGIAELKLAPDTVATRIPVSVAVGGVSSVLGFYDVVADVDTLSPTIRPVTEPFRINRQAVVQSGQLEDQYGNLAPDGIYASFRFEQGPNKWTIVPSQTVSQQVKGTLITREIAGDFDVDLVLGNLVSPQIPVVVERPNYDGLPGARAIGYPDIGAIDLVLGPFKTTDNSLLADGTQVSLEIAPATGPSYTLSSWTVDGFLREFVPISPAAVPIQIKVSTLMGNVDVDLTQATVVAPQADVPEDFEPRSIK